MPAVTWRLSIDSPYKLAPNGSMPPDRGVSTCASPFPSPGGSNGYESIVPYKIISFFNVQIANVGVYELLGQPANYVTNNWGSPTALGIFTNDGTFVDQLCIAGSYSPHPLIPQSPLSNNLIQQIPQSWQVGPTSPNSGQGIAVQTDTQNWFIDHARHTNVISPSEMRTSPMRTLVWTLATVLAAPAVAQIAPTPGSQPIKPAFDAADLVCYCFVRAVAPKQQHPRTKRAVQGGG